ncbi:MAG: hypothetical protein R3D62_00155 [Xanthobacteraceae bacterium]
MAIAAACAAASVTCNAQAAVAPKELTAASGFKIVDFDAAMKDQLVRSMPLKVAIPADYEILVLNPAINGVVWARRAVLDKIAQTNEVPTDAGYFRGRLTVNVGYDAGKGAFICGSDCDESRFAASLRESGASNVVLNKHVVNGIPVLLVDADMKTTNGAGRKLYMAYVATLIDTNVVLISYRPPSDSADGGAAVWKAFTTALTASTPAVAAGTATPTPAPTPTFEGYLDATKRSEQFRSVADAFISAATAGDEMKSMGLISPNALNQLGRDAMRNRLINNVLPFFAEYRELGRSTTVMPATDQWGGNGFTFRLTMRTKGGEERPFSISVIEENGAKVIAGVVFN